MTSKKLTKRLVEAAQPGEKDFILRDNQISGFHCKITPAGRRVYFLYYRTKSGRERRAEIGQHGDISCEQARGMALEWKAQIARGRDPGADTIAARHGPNMTALCQRYLEYAKPRKKAGSFQNDLDPMTPSPGFSSPWGTPRSLQPGNKYGRGDVTN